MNAKPPKCPLIGKPCIEQGCTFFVHITGMHPQSGSPMDLWDCSIKWTPIMMLDASKNMKGVQAAVETMRNDVCQRQEDLNNTLTLGAQMMRARQTQAQAPALPADVVNLPKLEG